MAWGKPAALAATASTTAFAIAKLALFQQDWGGSLLRLCVLFLPLLTSVIEGVAVARTRYTWEDPDWVLVEGVEAEQKERIQQQQQRQQGERRRVAAGGGGGGGNGAEGLYAPLLAAAEEGGTASSSQPSAAQAAPVRKKSYSTLYLLFRYAQPDHGLLAAGLGFILLSSLFRLALPNFAARLLTLVVQGSAAASDTTHDDAAALGTLAFTEAAAYFSLCAAGLAVFTALRIWATAKAEVRLVARLQRILFAAILRQDIATFDGTSTWLIGNVYLHCRMCACYCDGSFGMTAMNNQPNQFPQQPTRPCSPGHGRADLPADERLHPPRRHLHNKYECGHTGINTKKKPCFPSSLLLLNRVYASPLITLPPNIHTTHTNAQSGINLIGSTAYLFVLDARLAGAYLALVLVFFLVTRLFGAHAKKLQREVGDVAGGTE